MSGEVKGPCGLPSGKGRRRPSGQPRRYDRAQLLKNVEGNIFNAKMPFRVNADINITATTQAKDVELTPEDIVFTAEEDIRKEYKK